MLRSPSRDITTVQLEEIDSEDRTFSISPVWLPFRALIGSVKKVGVLSPLQIERTSEERYRIISGFRRYEAAKQVGLEVLPAFVREGEAELSLFLEALAENSGTRPLHMLEKAIALLKLQRDFQVDQETLIAHWLPEFGICADRFHMEHHLRLAQLPERLQRGIGDSLEPAIAVKLGAWIAQDQDLFLALFSRYQLGRNRQKELFDLLDELRQAAGQAQGHKRVTDLWEQAGAASVDGDENLSPSDRFHRILERLRRLRFPLLSQYEERYKQLRLELRIPPQIQFHAPRFFEEDRISVAFSFRNPEELRDLAERLSKIAEKQALEQIFKLL